MTRRTVIISGFGGGYEETCQRMLWKGVAYLSEAQPPLSIWAQVQGYEGVFGLLSTEAAGITALEAAAMHQAVMGHLYQIHQHGLDWWLNHFCERDPDRVVDWEGELMPSEPDRMSEE
jgi:hypothetical protein